MTNQLNQIKISDYDNLIHLITNKFPSHKEELFNECYIKLFDLQKTFNPYKGKFQTYAYKHLYFLCLHYVQENKLNHQSLDELAFDDDGSETTKADLLESDIDVFDSIATKDLLKHHENTLTDVELFIQYKYYECEMPVREIIRVYQPFHLIKSEKTIYKILKK